MKKIILIAAMMAAAAFLTAPGSQRNTGWRESTDGHDAARLAMTQAEEIAATAPTARSAGPRVQLRYEEAEADNDAFPPKEAEIWRQDVPLRAELQQVLLDACAEAGIDPLLMLGLIETESGFNEAIVSASGDYGLCQLNRLYFDPGMTPEENLQAGVSLLGTHMRTYGDISAALTAYNRGHDDGTRYYAAAVLEKAAQWGWTP